MRYAARKKLTSSYDSCKHRLSDYDEKYFVTIHVLYVSHVCILLAMFSEITFARRLFNDFRTLFST